MLRGAAVLLLGFPAPASAAGLTAADRAWIATCVSQLRGEPAPSTAAKRRYCVCMHTQFDDNQAVTQSAMEHMVPPLHAVCSAKAGWK